MPLSNETNHSNNSKDFENKFHHRPQRKIVKANQPVDFASQGFLFPDAQEKHKPGLSHSNSSSSLDFWMEGEKMVSALCDVSTDSITIENTNKMHQEIKKQLASVDLSNVVPLQIVQLAVEACSVAENIAVANKNRPCFKNIQTICEKTKGNVQKPDSAVANLHSQGVPWVIKNFIFSFIRILDGWKIIKELMYEKHDSFVKIEDKYYDGNIKECFMEWQLVTKNMLEHIFKTFKAMDTGFQMEQQQFKQNCSLVKNRPDQTTKEQNKTIMRPQTRNVIADINQSRAQWGTSYPAPQGIVHPLSQINSMNQLGMCQTNILPSCVKENDSIFNTNSMAMSTNWLRGDGNPTQLCTEIQKSSFTSSFTRVDDNCVQNIKVGEFADLIKIPDGKFNVPNKIQDGASRVKFDEYLCSYNKYNCGDNMKTHECAQTANPSSIVDFSNTLLKQNENLFMSAGKISDYESGNVYMKPGSYNILTKQSETLFSDGKASLETLTVHNSQAAEEMCLTNNNFQYPVGTRPHNYLGIKSSAELNEGFKMSDVTWEAAKQSAPQFMHNMNDFSKHNTTKDCLNVENIGKYGFVKNLLTKVEELIDEKTQQATDGETKKSTEEKFFNVDYDDAASSSSSKTCGSNMTSAQTQAEKLLKDFSWYNVKKEHKKNTCLTTKGGKKKKQQLTAWSKLEDVVVRLRSMEMSYFNNPSMVISKMKNFHKVIHKAFTFDDILDKMESSSYTHSDQILMDVRRVLYDAYAYLKVYSNENLQLHVDKMSRYFEGVCEEQAYHTHTYKDRAGGSRKHNRNK